MQIYFIDDLAAAFVDAANDSEEINIEYRSIYKLLNEEYSIYDIVKNYDLAYNMHDLLGDSNSDEESVFESIKSYDNDDLIDHIKSYL